MWKFPKIIHCSSCNRIIKIIYDPKQKYIKPILCNKCKMKINKKDM